MAERSEVGCGVGCNSTRKNACYARHFDLLHNSHSTVPPVRLRVGVICLGGFLDLCQLAKNKFFDKLSRTEMCGLPI